MNCLKIMKMLNKILDKINFNYNKYIKPPFWLGFILNNSPKHAKLFIKANPCLI